MCFSSIFVSPVIQHYEYDSMNSASEINSATLKIHKLDDLHTEAMMHLPQINTCAIVLKETGQRYAYYAVSERHISGRKPVALCIVVLHLTEEIS